MSKPIFTPEELEQLKRIDAEIDAEPVTLAEYEALDFIEGLLFPEDAKRKERARIRRRAYYAEHREECLEASRVYYEKHKDEIAARRSRWYQENKARVNAKQREYRIRTGLTRTPEQKEADKLAHAEARKLARDCDEYRERQRQYQLAYRARKKGMTVEEYVTYQEAKKKAVETATSDAADEIERKRAYQRAYREANKTKYQEYQQQYHRQRRARQQSQLAVAAIA